MSSQRLELIKKFQSEVDQADWEMLEPHFKRNVLFKVDRKLDIFEVAADLALDNVSEVKNYLDRDLLMKVSDEDKIHYESDKNKFFANFVVVQPFVIFQEYTPN